jgi:hypothetical protein
LVKETVWVELAQGNWIAEQAVRLKIKIRAERRKRIFFAIVISIRLRGQFYVNGFFL